MLITRETDYALRIIRALSDGKQITVNDICAKELLPQQFTYKILKKLERAGLVHISRGMGGGCRLLADLRQTSLYDLIELIEVDRLVSACMNPGFDCAWQKSNSAHCLVHKHLQQIQKVFDAELQKYTLHQMLFDER